MHHKPWMLWNFPKNEFAQKYFFTFNSSFLWFPLNAAFWPETADYPLPFILVEGAGCTDPSRIHFFDGSSSYKKLPTLGTARDEVEGLQTACNRSLPLPLTFVKKVTHLFQLPPAQIIEISDSEVWKKCFTDTTENMGRYVVPSHFVGTSWGDPTFPRRRQRHEDYKEMSP